MVAAPARATYERCAGSVADAAVDWIEQSSG